MTGSTPQNSSFPKESVPSSTFDASNPYRVLIDQNPTPEKMTEAYEKHRRTRNASKFDELSSSHKVNPDPILTGLVSDNKPEEFDPRNSIVIWCRPPSHVMDLIGTVQTKLVEAINAEISPKQPVHVPCDWNDAVNKGPLWLMPRECLHMTALEINNSEPIEKVLKNMELIKPHVDQLLNPAGETPILMRPLVCFDASALALTFVPIDHPVDHKKEETDVTATPKEIQTGYTHYRAQLYETVTKVAGIDVDSRYQVPSAHITIARFVKEIPPEAIDAILNQVKELNAWLDESYSDPNKFSWKIREERANVCRYGRLWYGGGTSEGTGKILGSQ